MINTIIPTQNFEFIRDAIANIIKAEVTNQGVLNNIAIANSGNYLLSCEVEVERSNPVDKIEVPHIIVSLLEDNFSNKHQGNRTGSIQFAVDIYTSAKTTATDKGDKVAAIRLQKLLGLVTYVLEDPIYKWLNFAPGIIGRTWVSGFQIRAIGENDAANQAMARLNFNVQAAESNALLPANLVVSSATVAMIDNTTQGYFIQNDF